jgi:hypothetical protein
VDMALVLDLNTGRTLGRRRLQLGISRATVTALTGIPSWRLGHIERADFHARAEEAAALDKVLRAFEKTYQQLRKSTPTALTEGQAE